MAYNRSHASRLCNAAEFALFEASTRGEIRTLTERELIARIGRARRLRDKQQDLFRRQRLESRDRTGSKSGKSGAANLRTEQKLKLFSEMLGRFEARLEALKTAQEAALARASVARATKREAARAAARSTTSRDPGVPGVPGTPQGSAFAGPRAEEAMHRMQLQKSRSRPIQAHIRSAGKRAQARRDSR